VEESNVKEAPAAPVVLEKPDALVAAARSTTYGALAECFLYPDEELIDMIQSGALADRLRELLSIVDPALVDQIKWENLQDSGPDQDALQVEYTRLFDVGAKGPPCALYGGSYLQSRMQSMEEAVRFYNHFGLSMSEGPHELPDHLSTQMEFLHFLAYQEAELREKGEDPNPFMRAERDFASRHPGRWVPQMLETLEKAEPMDYFLEVGRVLHLFLKGEVERLIEEVGKVPLAADGNLPIIQG
jgi:DMSO reductase family type II enzyme chaperone